MNDFMNKALNQQKIDFAYRRYNDLIKIDKRDIQEIEGNKYYIIFMNINQVPIEKLEMFENLVKYSQIQNYDEKSILKNYRVDKYMQYLDNKDKSLNKKEACVKAGITESKLDSIRSEYALPSAHRYENNIERRHNKINSMINDLKEKFGNISMDVLETEVSNKTDRLSIANKLKLNMKPKEKRSKSKSIKSGGFNVESIKSSIVS